ncbi:MAG: type II secretion system F family protein [Deltaproteobacteria bacterium]|nr:type II secretion system F family protein [Deltaproteobacteria bacterium]
MAQKSLFSMGGLDFMLVIGLVGAFVGVCFLVTYINLSVVEPYRQRRLIQKRLRSNKREQEFRAQIFKAYQDTRHSPVLTILNKLTGWGKVENLQRLLLQADIYLSPGVFVCAIGILGCLGFIIGLQIGGLWSWGSGAFMGFLPIFILRWKKKRKTAKFEKQMPEAMELLARSLRAGHTLQSTLELVSNEIPAPLGKEMRVTYEEQRLGLSVSQALRRMSDRVASQDLRYFVTAVLIQAETGGNLAEILENIGTLIRDRLKLKGKIVALTAEGRFSALVLIGLPILTFLVLYLINREYIMVLLTDPIGTKILTAGICLVILGALIMKKMIAIKV